MRRWEALGLVVVLSALVSAVSPAAPALGKPTVVEIEGVSYNTAASMGDNLRSLSGKRIHVTLGSGTTVAGTVKVVGEHLLHLEKLDGKDFYDALIRLDDIVAIDARFREFQQ